MKYDPETQSAAIIFAPAAQQRRAITQQAIEAAEAAALEPLQHEQELWNELVHEHWQRAYQTLAPDMRAELEAKRASRDAARRDVAAAQARLAAYRETRPGPSDVAKWAQRGAAWESEVNAYALLAREADGTYDAIAEQARVLVRDAIMVQYQNLELGIRVADAECKALLTLAKLNQQDANRTYRAAGHVMNEIYLQGPRVFEELAQ